ncbi:hypothetical protein IJJ12_02970 [bacterium]|nr:hypothetical protein [bacterium]
MTDDQLLGEKMAALHQINHASNLASELPRIRAQHPVAFPFAPDRAAETTALAARRSETTSHAYSATGQKRLQSLRMKIREVM